MFQNYGFTKSFDSSEGTSKEIDWKIGYNGLKADIQLNTYINNKQQNHYNFELNNQDIAKILRQTKLGQPLEKILKEDFLKNKKRRNHNKTERKVKVNDFFLTSTPSLNANFKTRIRGKH